MPNYEQTRKSCVVGYLHRPVCGKPRWGWTNYMEPICEDHFQQRRVIQNLLIMMSGQGNWGSLIWHYAQSEGPRNYDYDDIEDKETDGKTKAAGR